jgi:hypothetical protein
LEVLHQKRQRCSGGQGQVPAGAVFGSVQPDRTGRLAVFQFDPAIDDEVSPGWTAAKQEAKRCGKKARFLLAGRGEQAILRRKSLTV